MPGRDSATRRWCLEPSVAGTKSRSSCQGSTAAVGRPSGSPGAKARTTAITAPRKAAPNMRTSARRPPTSSTPPARTPAPSGLTSAPTGSASTCPTAGTLASARTVSSQRRLEQVSRFQGVSRDAVAQLVQHTSKVPAWCKSTLRGSKHGAA